MNWVAAKRLVWLVMMTSFPSKNAGAAACDKERLGEKRREL